MSGFSSSENSSRTLLLSTPQLDNRQHCCNITFTACISGETEQESNLLFSVIVQPPWVRQCHIYCVLIDLVGHIGFNYKFCTIFSICWSLYKLAIIVNTLVRLRSDPVLEWLKKIFKGSKYLLIVRPDHKKRIFI